jgi:hypothetical protein
MTALAVDASVALKWVSPIATAKPMLDRRRAPGEALARPVRPAGGAEVAGARRRIDAY